MERSNRTELNISKYNNTIHVRITNNGIYNMVNETNGNLVIKIARCCLAVGIFHLRFTNKYNGKMVQVVNMLRILGFIL
ncbi:50S ribosomal subunit protein L18 [Candidatus Hodgkinia cicadicola]|uniref:50S ribosomal subunit protein L18 n=1 Tax=Candidatus Hodgkinia cicadicola TaxID=573658 RepID=A0ABX4MEJ5_9HYPH|nr:50S ribosomal subunit protein L18 [Candidatus Hodgkinia cicadicola]PIM96501.1 50S ribosomal subunit protein L18 [Candidatus Hodgkinia cicadicola]